MSRIYPDFLQHNPIRRGDILISECLVDGYLDKIRPVVVVQNDTGNKFSRSVVVAAMTSKPKKELPVNVVIDPIKYGLAVEHCTIMLNHIFTVDKDYLRAKKGALDAEDIQRLDEGLRASLSLEQRREGKGMDELTKVFSYQGNQVRTVVRDGEPWFIAKDICDVLTISNGRDAVSRLDVDEKDTVVISDGTPGNPNLTIINEAGLYALVLTSSKPEAKSFKRWITHEVIPQIRKTGSYSVQTRDQIIAAGYAAALEMIEEMKPKAQSFDSLISADGLYTISDAAKVLNYENAGPKKMFDVLHSEGFLFKRGRWHAKQNYIDWGYFVEKTRKVDFSEEVYTQVYVTPKGLDMLDKHLSRNGFKKNPKAASQ